MLVFHRFLFRRFIAGYLNLLHLLIYKDFNTPPLPPVPHPLQPKDQTKEIYIYHSSLVVRFFITISPKALLTTQKSQKQTLP
jgi:hypothetical protein